MLKHALALAVALPLGITACGDLVDDAAASPTPDVAAAPAGGGAVGDLELDPCNARRAAEYIDEEASDETRRELTLSVMPIDDIRWIGAGQATNDDLRQDRLNVMLDVEGKIASVGCG